MCERLNCRSMSFYIQNREKKNSLHYIKIDQLANLNESNLKPNPLILYELLFLKANRLYIAQSAFLEKNKVQKQEKNLLHSRIAIIMKYWSVNLMAKAKYQ